MEKVKDTICLATLRSQYNIEQSTGHEKPTMDGQLDVSENAEHMGGWRMVQSDTWGWLKGQQLHNGEKVGWWRRIVSIDYKLKDIGDSIWQLLEA